MAGLIFIATFITVFILAVQIIISVIKHRSILATFRILAMVLCCYGLLWVCFYYKNTETAVPFGTDVCFDDWCATITKAETPKTIAGQNPHGRFIVLHIKMSNHAKGIAQKPSELRMHIIDAQGHSWAFSETGQQALEKEAGRQILIDVKLELHQTLETQLVFDIPQNAKNLKAIIEEGPFITKFLLHDNSKVFMLK